MDRPFWMNDVDGVPVARGLFLRSILVLALLDAGRPMTVTQLERAVAHAGYAVAGRRGKTVSDALCAEIRSGRVVRVGRGRYAAGDVAKVTRHRMRNRVGAMRNHAAPVAAMERYLARRDDEGLSVRCGTNTSGTTLDMMR